MEYDFVTLDTSIFDQKGLNLENGLLGQLTQFSVGSVGFVLSEIVEREVLAHLTKNARKAKSKLDAAITKAQKNHLIPNEAISALEEVEDKLADPDLAVADRWQQFVKATNLKIIPAALARMEGLVDHYFSPLPPFEASGDKKSEFPDAIALLSLEAWAAENDRKILVISDDTGWLNYGDTSDRIDVVKDLKFALQRLQAHTEVARGIVDDLVERISSGSDKNSISLIEFKLAEAFEWLDVEGTAEADAYTDVSEIQLSFQSFELPRDQPATVVRIGQGSIIFAVEVQVSVDVSADIFFTNEDLYGNEHPIGHMDIDRNEQYEVLLLISLNADPADGLDSYRISRVEPLDLDNLIEFGDVQQEFVDYFGYLE